MYVKNVNRLYKVFVFFSLRAARVLLIGLGGLGAEIAKNLTLSGIKSLTLLDDRVAAENSANFLISREHIGKNVTTIPIFWFLKCYLLTD